MLTLNDGRSELWQWDTGRTISVDVDCSQVHFSNKVFGRSVDVDVIDGIAIIPDILLQTDKDLTAWAFVGTPKNGYTKISKVLKVNKRNKPADYVFTPTEQTTLQELVERLDTIEENQDPDAIKNAVEDYLKHNPIDVPVESVNGKTGYVELTAEDVGAISLDDSQKVINEALAQAKASGEFDGPQGEKGDTGATGPQGPAGSNGTTPVKGVDYWTSDDQETIVQQVIAALGTPVFGRVDANNNIILTGELANGTYTIKYENSEGEATVIGNLSLQSGPVEIPLTWEHGAVLDKSNGKVSSTGNAQYSASSYTEVSPDKTYTLTRESAMHNTCNVVCYDANNNFVSYITLNMPSLNASGGAPILSAQFTVPANAAKIRLRLWYETTQNSATVAAMYKLIEELRTV